MRKDKKEACEIPERIKDICDQVWGVVAQEKSPNSMTIAQEPLKLSFRFNNYRRQILTKPKTNSTLEKIKSTIATANISQHTKVVTIRDYRPQIMIQWGKTKLTGIFCQHIIEGTKEAHVVEGDLTDISYWLDGKTKEIEALIDAALYDFCRQFGIRQRYEKPIWKRKELEIKGDRYIDSLPAECIIHDTVGKKVYRQGFEFNDEVYAKNYLKNRAIEDIAPQIAQELSKLHGRLDRKSHYEFLKGLIEECRSIQELVDKARAACRDIRLDMEEAGVLSDKIFNKWKVN